MAGDPQAAAFGPYFWLRRFAEIWR